MHRARKAERKREMGKMNEKEQNERNALFFDVDGTLMDADGNVPESAKEALHRTRARGNLVFINSGRPYKLARWILREVEADGLLCGCGTNLWYGEKEIYRYILPPSLLCGIREDCRRFHLDVFLEGPEGTAFDPENRLPHSRETEAFTRAQDGIAAYAYDDPAFEVSKFCLLTDEKSELLPFQKKYAAQLDFIDRGGGFYECVPKEHSKGAAVEKITEVCGIQPENTYGFGDSTNDIAMFCAVRHPVIMGVHDRELRPYGEFVTKPLEEDGIAVALRHYGLI